MADIKSINKDSSLNFKAIIREFRGYIVDPTKVHVKGKFFTAAAPVHEFEIDKGVATGCVLDGFMLGFNVDISSYREGRLRCATVIYQDADITGTTSTANEQFVPVQIVASGTSTNTDQGPFVIDIILYTSITDADLLAWNSAVPLPVNPDTPSGGVSPTLADVQKMVDTYMAGYFSSSAFAALLKSLNIANGDLSNVAPKSLLALAKLAGLAENSLVDVNLGKLQEKGVAAGLANKDMTNVPAADLDRRLKADPAFIALSKKDHPAVAGLTPDEIKNLFFTNRKEVQGAVDLTEDEYSQSSCLLLITQVVGDTAKVTQMLPPVSQDQIIMVEMVNSTGKPAEVEYIPYSGQQINGLSDFKVTVTEGGFAGTFIPVRNINSYEWIPMKDLQASSLSASDKRGNVIEDVKDFEFDEPAFLEHNDDTKETHVRFGNFPFMFTDGVLKQTFKATRLESLDKSIRLSPLPAGTGPDGNPIFMADLSVASKPQDEGIYAEIGWDTVWNSKFPKSRLNYGNVLVPGGQTVTLDEDTKSFKLGDISTTDDPSVTGGTTFLVAIGYKPNKLVRSTITQKGYLRAELVDNDGNPILDLYGNPMGPQNDYKAGEAERPMFYVGLCKIAADTLVHVQFSTNFATEELITVGSDSFVMFQAVTKDGGMGRAYEMFVERTGIRVNTDTKYYGKEFINLAQMLTETLYVNEYPAGYNAFGLNMFFSGKTGYKVGIENNVLVIQGNNIVPFRGSIGWAYSGIDGHLLKGKEAKVTAVMENPACDVEFAVIEYMGSKADYVDPEVIGFTGEDAEFPAGWIPMSKFKILIDTQQGLQTHTGILTLPTNSETFAIVAYPVSPAIGMTLKFKDIQVDIIPEHTHVIITDNSRAINSYLEYEMGTVSFQTNTPPGTAGLRYSVQSTDTKLPVGVISGEQGLFVNNRAWTDPGTGDSSAEGDLEAVKDVKVLTAKYQIQKVFNESDTESKVEFWIAKVNSDGSFTEIPGSRITDTIEAKRVVPKAFFSTSFSFVANKGDSYRLFAKSDKDDGFYLQSGTDGIPLFSLGMEVSEIEEVQRITDFSGIQLVDGDKPVDDPSLYNLQVDVKTFAIKVVKVK